MTKRFSIVFSLVMFVALCFGSVAQAATPPTFFDDTIGEFVVGEKAVDLNYLFADQTGAVAVMNEEFSKGASTVYMKVIGQDDLFKDIFSDATVTDEFIINQVNYLVNNSGIQSAYVTAPTASAFSIGGTEVTTVNGVLSDNDITFAVDPTANYTTASVTVSADVYVTVTEYGASEPSRADVNVEKGTLTADVALLGAFDMTRTSATGQELINKTEAGPITVLLKSQADATKTTTYTVNFVKAE